MQQGQGGLWSLSEFSVGQGAGELLILLLLFLLRTANIVLVAAGLIILTTKTLFLHLFSQPASLSGSALGLLVQIGKSFWKGAGGGTGWS